MKAILFLITAILLFLAYSKMTHVEEKPNREAQYLAEYETPEEKQKLQSPQTKQLILLTTTWCGACKQTKQYLNANHIPFTEYDAEKSEQGKSLMKTYKGRGYPTVIIGGESMTGFDSRWVEERL